MQAILYGVPCALLSFLLFILIPSFAFAEGEVGQGDWFNPDDIDPTAVDVGDYLAVELDVLVSAAQIAYKAGDYHFAAQNLLALTRCDIHDVVSIFDLACCYAHLGEPRLSMVFLKRAVQGGFENLERIEQEPAFEGIRDSPEYAETMGEITEMIEGKRATKRFYYATARYDETSPDANYELACCYALRSDARMATDYLVRAVQVGYRNLELIATNPEFDTIRETEEFKLALQAIEELAAPQEIVEEPEVIIPDTVYCEAQVALPCLVQLPLNYDPDRSYPLLIGLHGYGGNVERFASMVFAMDDPQFIYAVPEAPYIVPQQGYLGYSWWVWDLENKPLWDRTVIAAQDFSLDLALQLTSEYNISDVYLLGFSQGSALAYSVGINNPEVFDGIVAVGGWLDKNWFNEGSLASASDLRILIAHAEDDQSMKFDAGVTAREYLEEQGLIVDFYSYTGGHTLTEELLLYLEDWIEN